MKKLDADVVVIGGGAAGMLASAVAASRGLSVVLFEHNQYTGKKLRITGKGRCNLTNNCSASEVLENVPTNSRFLYSAVNQFSPADVMNLFERLGVKLKTERGNRVFPESDKAEDIVNALRAYMKDMHVRTVFDSVNDICVTEGKVCGVVADMTEVRCKNAILCTGGVSYPMTGSTGDGYLLAEKLGHSVKEPRPSLVPLEAQQSFCKDMQGLALKNVKITVFNSKNKQIFEDFGEMLFTHFGISGSMVLSASAHMRNFEKEKYYINIDLKPALDAKKLDLRILRDFDEFSNRDFANSLNKIVHKRMAPVLVKLSEIPPETKVNSITKQQRQKLLSILKGLRIDISGPRPIDEAIITSGGISVKEINPSTMESKLISNLFFAGEIIDVDAYTGGFNLQIAWSTAYTAAMHVEVNYEQND